MILVQLIHRNYWFLGSPRGPSTFDFAYCWLAGGTWCAVFVSFLFWLCPCELGAARWPVICCTEGEVWNFACRRLLRLQFSMGRGGPAFCFQNLFLRKQKLWLVTSVLPGKQMSDLLAVDLSFEAEALGNSLMLKNWSDGYVNFDRGYFQSCKQHTWVCKQHTWSFQLRIL